MSFALFCLVYASITFCTVTLTFFHVLQFPLLLNFLVVFCIYCFRVLFQFDRCHMIVCVIYALKSADLFQDTETLCLKCFFFALESFLFKVHISCLYRECIFHVSCMLHFVNKKTAKTKAVTKDNNGPYSSFRLKTKFYGQNDKSLNNFSVTKDTLW